MSNLLVKILGFPATLLHGDTLVLDRWLWLKKYLKKGDNKKLIDVGCGSGAFTIGAAKKGFDALGISFDERNQNVAAERANLSKVKNVRFEVQDVRTIHEKNSLRNSFDVAICLEVIEHILNDQKVINDIYNLLKPNGTLLLTTPYFGYKAIVPSDNGPFCTTETGWHVRRGYWEKDFRKMAAIAGFEVQKVEYCSGFLSQKLTGIFWNLQKISTPLAWFVIFPFRWLPLVFDKIITKIFKFPPYSICMVATKK